ncbi:helix-turn-helix transcriptional regulator [Larkinella humicola]|uniref:Helix-turn-helix transcriptional regulator n=1 Tax=Larkinella humicola TaxID=2607654 RepID=A0A5N1JFF7_9BACT|nr:LuxR C-terminal-related transcriptional regulator [Larkinella humicola]KAA9349370.1 helix-turn-helix transcriptional regulator [Larkinella humicola]
MNTMIGIPSNHFIASYITEIARSVCLSINIIFDIQQVEKIVKQQPIDWVLFDIYEKSTIYFDVLQELRLRDQRFQLAILVDNSVNYTNSIDYHIQNLKPDLVCGFHELPHCLRLIALGQRFLPSLPPISRMHAIQGWNELTGREKEVLWKLAEGKSTAEIAGILYISTKTVENHKANISSKLNVNGGPGSLLRFIFKNKAYILSTKY